MYVNAFFSGIDLAPAGEYISNIIESEMRKNGITGLSITVVEGLDTVYSAGFGYADTGKRIKMTTGTILNEGSVSKLFTATAVMQLAEQGKIGLDRPIQEYLPEFTVLSRFTNSGPITVRELLTHHSGLPSERLKGIFFGTNAPEGYTNEFTKLPGLFSNVYTAAAPNTIFSYCNLGFSLLGCIVSRVSGKDYESYLQENILKPLGMGHSSFLIKPEWKDLYSKGYSAAGETVIPYVRDIPAGGLNTTADDMSAFLKMLLNQGKTGNTNILKAATLKEMLTAQNTNVVLDGSFRIGLTYWLMPVPEMDNRVFAGHDGDLPPFHASLLFSPEKNIGVFILVNSMKGMGSLGLNKIACESLQSILEAKYGVLFTNQKPSPVVKTSAADLQALPGYYASSISGFSELKKNGDGLQYSWGGTWLDLQAHENGLYSLQFKLFGLFDIDTGYKVIQIKPRKVLGRQMLSFILSGVEYGSAEKVTPVEIPEAWMKRAGKYKVLNKDPWFSPDSFIMEYDRNSRFFFLNGAPLQPINDNEAVVMGLGRNMGDTIQAVNTADGERILYSGYELEKEQ